MHSARRKALKFIPAILAPQTILAIGQNRKFGIRKVGVLRTGKQRQLLELPRLMRSLGWIEGETIVFLARYDDGDPARLPALARELLGLQVDVLVVSARTLGVARAATATTPIMCPETFDPLSEGLTTSLAKPTGNVTGISWQSIESVAKRAELARLLVPGVRHVALITDTEPASAIEANALRSSISGIGAKISILVVARAGDISQALARLKAEVPDVLFISSNAFNLTNIDALLKFASAARTPTIGEFRAFAERGVLITFGPDTAATEERFAVQLDKILRGAKVSDVPFEQASKFELVVNMRTAKALNIVVPEAILLQMTDAIR